MLELAVGALALAFRAEPPWAAVGIAASGGPVMLELAWSGRLRRLAGAWLLALAGWCCSGGLVGLVRFGSAFFGFGGRVDGWIVWGGLLGGLLGGFLWCSVFGLGWFGVVLGWLVAGVVFLVFCF